MQLWSVRIFRFGIGNLANQTSISHELPTSKGDASYDEGVHIGNSTFSIIVYAILIMLWWFCANSRESKRKGQNYVFNDFVNSTRLDNYNYSYLAPNLIANHLLRNSTSPWILLVRMYDCDSGIDRSSSPCCDILRRSFIDLWPTMDHGGKCIYSNCF